MNHRKWARFAGLTAASLASLALGAFLSYEASVAQDVGHFALAAPNFDQPATPHPAVEQLVAVALSSTMANSSAARLTDAALSPEADEASGAFTASRNLLAPLTLTLRGEVDAAEAPASAPVSASAPVPAAVAEPPVETAAAEAPAQIIVHPQAAPVAAPAEAPVAAVEAPLPPPRETLAAAPEDEDQAEGAEQTAALFNGRPAPLPPPRPTGLIALAEPAAVVPPSVEPTPAAVQAPQAQNQAPQAQTPAPQADVKPAQAENKPPQGEGAGGFSPVNQAAALASQMAALAHQNPLGKSEPAPAAANKTAAAAPAGQSQNGFPNISGALAAVTASVGGNAAVTPMAPAQPTMLEPDMGNFKKGSPVYVRIFKREGVLELWLKRGERFALYKSYPICKWSGQLGPKTRSADYQSPEGFYSVSARQLNPHSHYHLAFDVGYPNAYDRRQGATGNAVMVHGDCKSVGCFAMTNNGIDEIYGIVAAALAGGQREVPVHIFPFRMTEQAIVEASAPKQVFAFMATPAAAPQRDWSGFWRNLKEGYDAFERSRVPPTAFACGDRYEFNAAGRSCSRIAGW